MNKEQASGQWQQLKGKFKEQWGKLTDDDLETFNGKKDQFFGKIKEHYGIGKEEAEKQTKAYETECGCDSTNKKDAA
jgi:uncharacterized protein YjbJ (UPF0337 family)